METLTHDAWITAAGGRPARECWGKGRPTGSCPAHPLLCHLLDVAAVARYLLTIHAPLALRRRLLAIIGGDEGNSLALLQFVIALHDLGKYTPAFQAKLDWARRLLPHCGFDVDPPVNARHHGKAGLGFVRDVLCELGVSSASALTLARAVVAHHGEFPTNASLNREPMGSRESGRAARWNDARREAVDLLRNLFDLGPRATVNLHHADVVQLAGLTVVADWIGSMDQVFYYEPPQASLGVYWSLALERAEQALDRAGMRPYSSAPGSSFCALFPTYNPWPLHVAAESLATTLSGSSLMIVEAPMGEGKTEAAFPSAESKPHRPHSSLRPPCTCPTRRLARPTMRSR